jgi:hypothetical protein
VLLEGFGNVGAACGAVPGAGRRAHRDDQRRAPDTRRARRPRDVRGRGLVRPRRQAARRDRPPRHAPVPSRVSSTVAADVFVCAAISESITEARLDALAVGRPSDRVRREPAVPRAQDRLDPRRAAGGPPLLRPRRHRGQLRHGAHVQLPHGIRRGAVGGGHRRRRWSAPSRTRSTKCSTGPAGAARRTLVLPPRSASRSTGSAPADARMPGRVSSSSARSAACSSRARTRRGHTGR